MAWPEARPTGRPGVQKRPKSLRWSQIIYDPIENGAKRSINHRHIFPTPRGGKQPRVYNYAAFQDGFSPAPSFVRCSLKEALEDFDSEFSNLGEMLESESRQFSLEEKYKAIKPPSGKEPPPNFNRFDGEGDGGGSFMIFRFQDLKAGN